MNINENTDLIGFIVWLICSCNLGTNLHLNGLIFLIEFVSCGTSLSNSTRCKDTSDFQGGTNKNAYYVTTLNKQKIGVRMYKASLFNWRIKYVEKQ